MEWPPRRGSHMINVWVILDTLAGAYFLTYVLMFIGG